MFYMVHPFFFLSFFVLVACSSIGLPHFCGCCHSKHICVISEPITPQMLASVHVNAPDPRHEINAHGQRLYLSWKLPKECEGKVLKGILKLQFQKPEKAIIPFKIDHLKGEMIYEITNEEYFEKEGILAYRVEIYSEGKQIDVYEHSMWSDLITFEN